MSKMVQEKDMENKEKYLGIYYCEFLEMICRVALYSSQQDDMLIHHKIEEILDQLLSLVDIKRKEVINVDEINSESDPDY